jgi:TonB family protein
MSLSAVLLLTLVVSPYTSLANAETKVSKGGLESKVIHEMMGRHRRQIAHCDHTKGAARGTMKIRFVIGGDGAVTSTRVEESTLGDEKIEGCVQELVAKIRFPEPQGGGTVEVSYPITFTPAKEPAAKAEKKTKAP